MQTTHRGIILKTYVPHKQKFVILDERYGKIVAIPSHRSDLSVGSLIDYTIARQGSYYFIRAITIHDLPISTARHDIVLLHAALELCYYFMPQESICSDTWRLLQELYSDHRWLSNPITKKLFLITLCTTLGVYPSQERYSHCVATTIAQITQQKSILCENIIIDEQDIDAWLHSCIYSHPIAHVFKTVTLLKLMEKTL